MIPYFMSICSSYISYNFQVLILFVFLLGNLIRNITNFTFNELRSATDNFNSSNKIGRGGFGTVYKVIRFCICSYYGA